MERLYATCGIIMLFYLIVQGALLFVDAGMVSGIICFFEYSKIEKHRECYYVQLLSIPYVYQILLLLSPCILFLKLRISKQVDKLTRNLNPRNFLEFRLSMA
jgi:hypothetical protein